MINENRQLGQLPEAWVWARLGDLGEVNLGKTPNKSQYRNSGKYKIIKFRDIQGDRISWDKCDRGFVLGSQDIINQLRILEKGDVLVAASAHSSEHIGRKVVYVYEIPSVYDKVLFVGELLCIRLNNQVLNPRITYYYLLSQAAYHSIQSHVRGGHLLASEARQIGIPLPPLPEQHRIVAKIEELLTRLDAGQELLKKVKAQLSRYRQAVLKHAFEGNLTKEWREARKGEMEPGSVLLERIKQEQKKNAKGKYKVLPPLDTSTLPELPEVWTWARVGDLYDIIGGGTPSTSRPEYWDGDIPWITSADIYGVKEIRPRKTITRVGIENSATNLVPAGSLIVVTRVGLGKIAITGSPLCFSQDSQALVGNNSLINPVYSLYYLSKEVQRFKYEHRGTTIAGVTKKQLAELTFALPPLAEQQNIVKEIERHFSVADDIEKVVEQSLMQAERLRQSILRRAFEGKLVPEDPTDEPAEKLLERIRVERTKREVEAKTPNKVKGKVLKPGRLLP